jgi:hypothetical protein
VRTLASGIPSEERLPWIVAKPLPLSAVLFCRPCITGKLESWRFLLGGFGLPGAGNRHTFRASSPVPDRFEQRAPLEPFVALTGRFQGSGSSRLSDNRHVLPPPAPHALAHA